MCQRRNEQRQNAKLKIRLERGEGVVRDLSASGIYFLTDAPLKLGESLRFTLKFENAKAGPISANCVARIVRVENQGKLKGVAASIKRIKLYGGELDPD
ncbi:MAG: PilZ domain-containing protein [Burkholderiales bacterium]